MRRISLALVASAFCVIVIDMALAQSNPLLLLVLEKQDRTMAIVDPVSTKVLTRVPVGEDPHEVVTSSDGKTAYVSNYGGPGSALHTISVVDLTTQKPLPPIDLGILHSAHGLAFVGGKLYFTAETNKMIGRYDPATKQIDWLLGTGQNRTHMIVVSKDEGQIFVSNVASSSIGIIDKSYVQRMGPPPGSPGAQPVPGFPPPPAPATPPPAPPKGWNVTIIPTGGGVEGFDVSPDGKTLWAANADDGTVSVIDIVAKKVTETLTLPGVLANRLKFTPDGKTVLISYLRSGDLAAVDVATRKITKTLKVGAGASGVLLSPDGATAYVGVGRDNKVAIVDVATLTLKGDIATGKGPDGMAWAARP